MCTNLHYIFKKITHIAIIIGLLFFTILMIRLSLPYFSFKTDVAFLRIKQWVFREYNSTLSSIWISAFYIHVFTSIFALTAGFTQFFKKLIHTSIHRIFGATYIITVLCFAGPSGFIMGIAANGGIFSIIAFILLSILWWYFTFRAYTSLRRKNYNEHARFMIRSYALTLAAITLRLWKFTIVNYIYEVQPMDLYRIVAWLGWIPNLIIAEFIIFKKWYTRLLKVNKL